MLTKISDYAWVATHPPLSNKTLQLAIGDDMPPNVRLVVSGYVHLFQAVDFGGLRAPQLIVGTGGNNNLDTDYKTLNSVTYSGFGYTMWERLDEIWSGTLFDVDGSPVLRCRLTDRVLNCGS